MKVDKKSVLIVLSVVVVVVLLVAAGVLLVLGIMQFNESEAKLNLAKKRLKELYDGKPFPSHQNVALEKANVNLLSEWFLKLTASLRKGQIEPVQKSPSTFMSLLQAKKPELIRQANATGKVVPETFGFGFERYFNSSALPEPNDVPRLTQQFTIIEKLCEVLFSEKIDTVTALKREEFESGADMGSARAPVIPRGRVQGPAGGQAGQGAVTEVKLVNKNAGVLGDEDLYAKFHFVLDFKAKEKVLWNVLNKFSSHEMFVVVTGVQAVKEGSDMTEIKMRSAATPAASVEGKDKAADGVSKPGPSAIRSILDRRSKVASDAAAAAAAIEEKPEQQKIVDVKRPREERIVCGPDLEKPMNVKVEIDVYRFRGE